MKNIKQNLPHLILPGIGFMAGLISIIGGIAALGYQNQEMERYLVSAVIMLCGGVLWCLSSFFPNFRLHKREYAFIFPTLALGLMLGLFYKFTFCGGECGGSYCHWYLGYPGYWLKASKCAASLASPYMQDAYWKIDVPNLMADIVFWIDTGVIFSFIWKFVNSKTLSTKI